MITEEQYKNHSLIELGHLHSLIHNAADHIEDGHIPEAFILMQNVVKSLVCLMANMRNNQIPCHAERECHTTVSREEITINHPHQLPDNVASDSDSIMDQCQYTYEVLFSQAVF
ncbi:MAG: hypothetical protein JW860_05840 [Sedimentisphaerales bacterium]|nr:hypothetical protein [Sedimentisphaerales bacterium]